MRCCALARVDGIAKFHCLGKKQGLTTEAGSPYFRFRLVQFDSSLNNLFGGANRGFIGKEHRQLSLSVPSINVFALPFVSVVYAVHYLDDFRSPQRVVSLPAAPT